jgi:branched-chain amino acid transport system permease protein
VLTALTKVGLSVSPEFPVYRLLSLTLAEVAPILPYMLLVLMLIFRPKGLLGTRES